MNIDIDRGLCIGSGQCVLNAPEVFTQDDDGLSALLPEGTRTTGHSDDPLAREAAHACPVQAITVTDGPSAG
ncbi:ferredoxin [Streptomyces sp. NPDC003077]|uniref:ferredoxin n=1 Tax=Streptomyces sp. NPDC003077 TaxID=3154443 RepID=UPI0033BC8144